MSWCSADPVTVAITASCGPHEMGARRDWFKHDAWFLADDKIRDLGHEFGAAGPLLAEALMELAKRQKNGGDVTVRWSYLAEHAFCRSVSVAQRIVDACARLGLIRIEESDRSSVTVFLPKWESVQGRGLSGAERTAAWRERHGDVTESSPKAVDVTSQNGHGDVDVTEPRARSREGREEVRSKKDEANASSRRGLEIDPADRAGCRLLAELMVERDPKLKAKINADSERWLTDMRLLRERDGRSSADIEKVIRWSQASAFWAPNILSPGKLRDQFGALWGHMLRPAGAASQPVEDSAAYVARRGGS